MEENEIKRVVIAGGSGFLGQALTKNLEEAGYDVVVLTRNATEYTGAGRAAAWDAETLDPAWVSELEGAKAVVNLTGESVDCRDTSENRERVLQSRIKPVEALGRALRLVYRVPETWVQAGSLAIYGNAGDRVCDESAHVPGGYPSDVCIAWEEALGRAVRPEMRWSVLRIGIVLGREGGALPKFVRVARSAFGGASGAGTQWISWIHIDDMVRIFRAAIENPAIHGIFNATGMQPVTNAEFMEALRRATRTPFSLPVPEMLVRFAAPLLRTDANLVLHGRRALPVKIHGLGFGFRFHDLDTALADLLAPETVHPEAVRRPRWEETFAR